METILGIILGLVVGGGCTWLVLRGQIQTAREKAKADLVAERAGMIERLHQKDQQGEELRQTIRELQTQLEQSHYAMREESARRAAAEARMGHLPQLEQQLRDREARLAQAQGENTLLKAKLSEIHTQLINEQKATQDKVVLLEQAQMRLADTFKALSADALQHNNQSFLELAQSTLATFQSRAEGSLHLKQQAIDEVVKPLRDALIQVNGKLQVLERDRISAYASLTEQLKSLATSQTQLQSETANLVKALRAPTVRGRWGEIQLKRVVEMAGMVEYCDFVEQMSVDSENGRLRPDMVIKLPNARQIIVDSKAPLQAYLEAMDAPDDAIRREKLQHHARQVRTHLAQLGNKAYWDQFQASPEFVVLFLPGETFFSAALEHDPQLIEYGVNQSVILATPTTLIALLKAVAYGWRQEKMAENAQIISALGNELYDRVRVLTGHFVKLRKGLETSVRAFNTAAGSLETRVLVSARKFKDLGAASGDPIDSLAGLDLTPRMLQGLESDEENDDKLSAPDPQRNLDYRNLDQLT